MWPVSIHSPLVALVGPTAVGKTEIALQLAERLDGEIVSADSRLFYRGMDIGTAKPTLAEQQRIPHYLIDVANPDENWSLPVFQEAARAAVREIHEKGKLPFLVGGTGQYVKAVIEGWEIPSQEPDQALRGALEHWALEIGSEGLHRRLAVVDPASATQIDARNVRRTIRALEVTLGTGRPFSEQRKKTACPYAVLLVGLKRPRVELYERIDRRIDAMLAGGLLEEVKQLLDKGYSSQLPTLSAIGYREMIAYLEGRMSLEEAVVQMKRITRRFVRHQGAWFSEKDPVIHWFQVGPETVNEIEALIRSDQGWILPAGGDQDAEA